MISRASRYNKVFIIILYYILLPYENNSLIFFYWKNDFVTKFTLENVDCCRYDVLKSFRDGNCLTTK